MTRLGTAWFLILWLWLAVGPAPAQVPAAQSLPENDGAALRAEAARIESLLISAPDKAAVTYQMARLWASAKQWPEAMAWLHKAVEFRAGLDPSRDSIFQELRSTREFKEIVRAVAEATPAISQSRPAFRANVGGLVPESVAFDPKGKRFYFGSMKKGEIVRCSMSGDCARFAGGLGVVLGLKAQGDALWLLNNSEQESDLIQYDLPSTRIVHKYSVAGAGHTFNDLVIAPSGDIYLTDTPAGAIWRLANGSGDLERLPGRFPSANGITLSPDGKLLFVSTFPDGIDVVDLKTGGAKPIGRPASLCLAAIDGLYFHRGALIAVQNGFMTPRVARFRLARNLRAIERFEVLERRNPLFEGVTTGVIAGEDFFYMANIQDDRTAGFDPITMLKLRL